MRLLPEIYLTHVFINGAIGMISELV